MAEKVNLQKQGQPVNLEIKEGLGILTINNPPVNSLSAEVISALELAIDSLAEDKTLKALIITGAGEKAFVAGADIKQFPDLDGPAGEKQSATGQKVFNKVAALKIPVIAAINGYALGGGCELALACDLRVAAENAKFGQPEVNLGIIPGYGGTQRLARLVGPGKAKELIFSGEMINAEEALIIGLVEKVVPQGTALEVCVNFAKVVISRGPVAVSLAKEAIDRGLDLTLEEGLQLEVQLFGKVMQTEDKNEGTKAFLEKRVPNFQGK